MKMFSVVIPVYNRSDIIETAINSLLSQTYRDFECLIIDDGSIDGEETRQIVSNLNDERFRYFRFENGGASIARNRGIELASGRFIAFLDSDDEFMPNKLEKIAKTVLTTPAGIYFAEATVVRGDGISSIRPSRGPMPNEPLDEYLFCALEPIQTTTLVVDSGLAKKSPFVPGLKKYEEAIFILNILKSGCKVVFIPEVLTVWNDHRATGRLGSRRELDNMRGWYRSHGQLLSQKARLGFRANVLSYEYGWQNPFLTAMYVAEACFKRGIGVKRGVHSLMRALVPQTAYRPIVNAILRRSL